MNYKNYKKFVGVGVSGMMMLSVISPAFALAEGANDPQSTGAGVGKKEIKGNFCDNLPVLETRLTKNENRETKINSKKDEAMSRVQDNWTKADSKRDEMQAKRDARKIKINTDAFRDGATTIMNDRKTALLTIATTHKTAITDALTKAKTDCAGGIDAQTVKTNFDLAKKTADQKMKTDRNALLASKNRDALKALMETRKQAIKTAQDAFKAGLEQAKATLKQAVQNPPVQ